MRTYRRIEHKQGSSITGDYKLITEINGTTWKQWSEWEDGTVTRYTERTLKEMGWHSLDEFLRTKQRVCKEIKVKFPFHLVN